MNSIYSTQNENTIYQRQQAKKENNENKKVQFANVAFSKFLAKSDKMLRNVAVSSNLENLTQNSSQTTFNPFISHFDTGKLSENSQGFELSNELLDKLNELIKNYNGSKGELKDSESFLLGLMKDIVAELEELGFESADFEAYYEEYAKQTAKKEELKNEIIELANEYMRFEGGKVSEKMLLEIESKLSSYYEALQDSDLRSFFAPLMPYLKPSEQENIVKALYTIKDELETPQAFELNGGKKLSWKVEEGKILFRVLSDEELADFQAERQKSKIFEIMSEAYELNAVNLGLKTSLNIALNHSNSEVGLDLNTQNLAISNEKNSNGLLERILQMNFDDKNGTFQGLTKANINDLQGV